MTLSESDLSLLRSMNRPNTHWFVAVAGNLGVGKSTLTRLIGQHLGWTPFCEAVDDNPYLADFYRDMARWSFFSQVYFLGRWLRHHRQLLDHPGSVVQDRSVYEDAEIFAANLYRQGYMVERDYRSYRELYEAIVAFLPPPHLIVYLQASVETLVRRVRLRGRDYEQGMAVDYLAKLNQLYEAWIDSFALCPVLTIPTDELDFVAEPAHLAGVMDRIVGRLQELQPSWPAPT